MTRVVRTCVTRDHRHAHCTNARQEITMKAIRLGMTMAFACAIAVSGCNKSPNTPQPAPANQPTQVSNSTPGVVPAGQELDVRLQNELSSETAKPEQSFETTTVVNLEQNGTVLVPAGSTVRGIVK